MLSRRELFATLATAPVFAGRPDPSTPAAARLRADIVRSPVQVALHRATTYTRVFRERESDPWIVKKSAALREHFATVPLYLRPGDRIAGSIAETPGAMPLFPELGIGENDIYTGERPDRAGYLANACPREIRDYWRTRNAWARYHVEILGRPAPSPDPQSLPYKFISCQGHLSPSYSELLAIGLPGLLAKVKLRQKSDPNNAFLTAAGLSLEGLQIWITRYADHLETAGSTPDHRELARVCRRVSAGPPASFREAMQLVWFAHQAIHVEGHGYSCTPDRIDQILFPFYARDVETGRTSREEALALCENFVLKQYDNTFWGPEHHLTQGLVLGGSSADGQDQCNPLTRIFLQGAANMALPEPLVWLRWHPSINQAFFDEALSHLAKTTCVPMFWNDAVVTAGLLNLGVSKEDAYNYTPVGCNELGIPGQFYFNPGSGAAYLPSIEYALTAGRGYQGQRKAEPLAPPPSQIGSFEQFTGAAGAYLRESIQKSYDADMKMLQAQIKWTQTPLTSCFFHGCVERGKDMVEGTKYNLLSCNGIAFANAVDCLAALRTVVFERKEATLEEVAAACRDNFKGHERLRGKLLAAPKHGNDDPRLDSIIRLVEKMRDEPMHEICRDPRDGSRFGNTHVVRSAAVRGGKTTPATPDGRLAGTPLASSVAASVGCERSGPTALLNSVAKLDAAKSWQLAYQVNIRFQSPMLANPAYRRKVRDLVNVYFARGGQQLQINALDTETLRAAQKNPEQYRDLVVRIAGFSEFFVNLTPDMQEDIINRAAHT